MGKIIATYLVKVTLRQPDTDGDGEAIEAPTNDAVAEAIDETIALMTGGDVSATSERTDR